MGASWINRFIFIGGVVNACREAKCTRVTYLSRKISFGTKGALVYIHCTHIYIGATG